MAAMSNGNERGLKPALAAAPGVVAGVLLGALALLACQWAGDALMHALGWPVPGAVAGMLLLWAGLCVLRRVPRGLDTVASALLSHLMLPLIPLVAGVSEHGAVLRQHGPALLLLCLGGVVATTACAAAAYALAVRRWG
jgi:putative effector of murein hydrolase LrgA (UPF0299 family)